jgi:hypothetical protein
LNPPFFLSVFPFCDQISADFTAVCHLSFDWFNTLVNQVPPGCLWLLLLRMVTGLSPIKFYRCLSKFSFVQLAATMFYQAFLFLSIDYCRFQQCVQPFGWLAATAKQLKLFFFRLTASLV